MTSCQTLAKKPPVEEAGEDTPSVSLTGCHIPQRGGKSSKNRKKR